MIAGAAEIVRSASPGGVQIPPQLPGPPGPTGPGNTLAIGTVTTGAPGSSATATITGTAPSQTLNLDLPQGQTGPANSLAIGTVSTTAPGSSATATITGTAPNQTLNLGLPQGQAGPTNSLSIGTVSTLAAGSSATATITGSSPSQTLNLGIPKDYDGSGTVSPTGTIAGGHIAVFDDATGKVIRDGGALTAFGAQLAGASNAVAAKGLLALTPADAGAVPNTADGLAALLASLPTTLPSAPGKAWMNGGVLSLS